MKTNSLEFTDNRVDKYGTSWEINIRLNDKHNNGHQDFSITGTSWAKGRPKTDVYIIRDGACGDMIAGLFPEYAIFNRLHLCDYKGIPMHCSANGFFHLTNGFNSQTTGEQFIDEYCQYYRITKEQFMELNKAENVTHFAIILERLGVFKQWELEAKEAIKILEELTGNEFLVDSKTTNYYRPSEEKIKEEEHNQLSGYYSDDKKRERAEEERATMLRKIDEKEADEIAKIRLEYEVKRVMLDAGEKAFRNYIFYRHKNQIAFNWCSSYPKMSYEEIQQAKEMVTTRLPEGVTIE